MDFWNTYEKRSGEPDFGAKQLSLNTGERYNISLSAYQEMSIELGLGKAVFKQWNPKGRYLMAKNLDFELFASFYDVNSKAVLALRLALPIEREELRNAKRLISGMGKANLELRVIGLQNGDLSLVPSIKELKAIAECSLVEVDLFGNQTRHLIIDLLTGKPYSLLLENRIYRPGELITAAKKEDFEMMRSKLDFSKV